MAVGDLILLGFGGVGLFLIILFYVEFRRLAHSIERNALFGNVDPNPGFSMPTPNPNNQSKFSNLIPKKPGPRKVTPPQPTYPQPEEYPQQQEHSQPAPAPRKKLEVYRTGQGFELVELENGTFIKRPVQ